MEETVMYFGIFSLLPVVLTIGLAIWSKNVVMSLFIGVLSGALLITGGNPVTATKTLVGDYIFAQLQDGTNAGVIVLLCFIGGFVTLIEISGGAESFARWAAGLVNSRCKVQIASWIAGIGVFFSELGTPLIVGPVFGPLFQKLRVSKEKLAWILDTTASPVCVLVPFIGWGVYSMGLLQTEFEALNITEVTDWTAFISAIPFQIYPILCLLIVPMVAFSGREFSMMAKAEKNAKNGIFAKLDDEEEAVLKQKSLATGAKSSPWVIALPLIVLFVTLFGNLIPEGFPTKPVPGNIFRIALITGYLYGAITMIIMLVIYKIKKPMEAIKTYIKGFGKMFECICILVLAWSLGSMGKVLGTADFIIELAKGNVPAWIIPAIIFVIGALISFSTGSSWGTFAIMMPIAIPMAIHMDAPLFVCIGAVLSGGLFGDHCSPISDTTILAATGAGCSLLDHVKTQLPYALLCGGVSFVGFLFAGFFNNVIITVASAVLLFVVFYFASKLRGIKIENLHITDIDELERQEAAAAAAK